MDENKEYNEEPVFYCKSCLSLKIINNDIDYCDTCGSTDTSKVSIEQWQELYKKRYGRKYINNLKF